MTRRPERKEVILARNLSKSFPARRGLAYTISEKILRFSRQPEKLYIFENIDFSLQAGDCVAIQGANGSGKSTFLRCLAGVIEPTQGKVFRLGETVAILSHGFGAYEELPVWRNILLAQQLLGVSRKLALENMKAVAEIAGLSQRMLSPTSQLSEGMRAKITLAALMHAPFEAALLDESLNHVDTDFKELFLQFTRKSIAQGKSFLLTSHDDHLLRSYATKSILIDKKSFIEL